MAPAERFPMSKALLALDLGTTTGWAAGTTGALVSGVWGLKPSRWEGGGMKFVKFRQCLNEIQASRPIDLVVYEAVRRHAGTDAAHSYGGLLAVLTEWCEVNHIPYEGVTVQAIKSFWTGKGNASKDAMVAEAVRRGFMTTSDDEADALALFHLKVGALEATATPVAA
jgi:crossover junction endodeoxyribonuclease RuvC